MAKKDAKPRLIRWVLLLQEFDFKVKDRKGIENQIANHLSRLEDEAMQKLGEKSEIDDTFPDDHVLSSSHTLFHGSQIWQITLLVISSHRTCLFIKVKISCMI